MGALHLPESKKNAKSEDAVIVFEDEASFRQTPTLHATCAKGDPARLGVAVSFARFLRESGERVSRDFPAAR